MRIVLLYTQDVQFVDMETSQNNEEVNRELNKTPVLEADPMSFLIFLRDKLKNVIPLNLLFQSNDVESCLKTYFYYTKIYSNIN